MTNTAPSPLVLSKTINPAYGEYAVLLSKLILPDVANSEFVSTIDRIHRDIRNTPVKTIRLIYVNPVQPDSTIVLHFHWSELSPQQLSCSVYASERMTATTTHSDPLHIIAMVRCRLGLVLTESVTDPAPSESPSPSLDSDYHYLDRANALWDSCSNRPIYTEPGHLLRTLDEYSSHDLPIRAIVLDPGSGEVQCRVLIDKDMSWVSDGGTPLEVANIVMLAVTSTMARLQNRPVKFRATVHADHTFSRFAEKCGQRVGGSTGDDLHVSLDNGFHVGVVHTYFKRWCNTMFIVPLKEPTVSKTPSPWSRGAHIEFHQLWDIDRAYRITSTLTCLRKVLDTVPKDALLCSVEVSTGKRVAQIIVGDKQSYLAVCTPSDGEVRVFKDMSSLHTWVEDYLQASSEDDLHN